MLKSMFLPLQLGVRDLLVLLRMSRLLSISLVLAEIRSRMCARDWEMAALSFVGLISDSVSASSSNSCSVFDGDLTSF